MICNIHDNDTSTPFKILIRDMTCISNHSHLSLDPISKKKRRPEQHRLLNLLTAHTTFLFGFRPSEKEGDKSLPPKNKKTKQIRTPQIMSRCINFN